jgi:hypothetical protein
MEVRGVKTNELDAAIGRDRYVSKIVTNKRKKPGAEVSQRIATYLRVDHAWLVTGQGIAPTTTDDLGPPSHDDRAPEWREDPAWPDQRAMALAHRPEALPAKYIEELGEWTVPGNRPPTWPLMLKMAEAIWLADITAGAHQGEGEPPSGVTELATSSSDKAQGPVGALRRTGRR